MTSISIRIWYFLGEIVYKPELLKQKSCNSGNKNLAWPDVINDFRQHGSLQIIVTPACTTNDRNACRLRTKERNWKGHLPESLMICRASLLGLQIVVKKASNWSVITVKIDLVCIRGCPRRSSTATAILQSKRSKLVWQVQITRYASISATNCELLQIPISFFFASRPSTVFPLSYYCCSR